LEIKKHGGLLLEIAIDQHHHNHDTNNRSDIQLKSDEAIHGKDVVGVQLIAGWACRKEAVKLTEPIYFALVVPHGSNISSESDDGNVPYYNDDEL
jgi:hypothetical protein